MKKLYLKPKKAQSVRRFHPWIFSGAIGRMADRPVDGELVEVLDHNGRYLAKGHYQDGSIAVRVISFVEEPVDAAFWEQKLFNAFHLRERLGIVQDGQTNCYRLVHGEGDGLPGLIIDVYGKTAVVQCHDIGMHQSLDQIAAALAKVMKGQLEAIYDKSHESLPARYAAGVQNAYRLGEGQVGEVVENGHRFWVDWERGQKTGFFLDQRDNRQLLSQYAAGKSVLNTFCYSGGFSIYALAAGAREVASVDASKKAIEWTEKNAALNDGDDGRHQAHAEDVLRFLKEMGEKQYEIMVVDPPAYAKTVKKRHAAVQGYKRLNVEALKRTAKGGLLFTFSCSQVVDFPLFYNTIVAAAIEAGRGIRVLHRLSQPPDHPVNIFHAEGSYLKGLVLSVD
ncbi:MAG: class I SAM-dependent rRNA methyltransferase [Bacteroidota bacterium]